MTLSGARGKLERSLNQLAGGEISNQQFELVVRDLKTLTEMKALELDMVAKASAQRVVAGVTKLVINGLVKAV